MRKLMWILVVASVLLAFSGPAFAWVISEKDYAGQAPVKILINGKEFTCLDQKPFTLYGRTYLPFREIGEALGYKVDYVPQKGAFSAIISWMDRDGTYVYLYPGSTSMYVVPQGDQSKKYRKSVDIPLVVKETNRTVLPIRPVAEAFGWKVDWDGKTRTVTLTKGV